MTALVHASPAAPSSNLGRCSYSYFLFLFISSVRLKWGRAVLMARRAVWAPPQPSTRALY